MKLPKLSVNRPVGTTMAFLAILLLGLVSLVRLPLDIMPEMELPTLTVMTVYPGASAEEVEEQVTKPLEELLAGTESLKEITSTSKENVSFISLQFSWDAEISEAANNARDLIELAKRNLPDGSKSPVIYKINSSLFPVLVYGISAQENYQGINEIIEDKVANPIKKVEGVGSVIYIGQPIREIQINIDPAKLQAYHLPIKQIATVLEAENITIPGGTITVGQNDFAVRVPGKFTTLEQIKDIALLHFQDQVIRLKDVATIKDSFKDKDELARSKNGLGVAMMIQKQSGVNTLEVANGVRAKVKEIRNTLPPDMEMFEIINTDELIVQSINNLTETIWWALLFVAIIVFLFLREWRSSLIVFLTIPFALIIAFVVMFLSNFTINIFSLMALVIAIGMVVDNAIVVLENIMQHIEKGSRPKQAAIFGASEMGTAITASTATTLMVFIPMIFVGGVVGILFKQLAILTSVTMVASLLSSLTLTPMLSAQLIKGKEKNTNPKRTKIFKWSERLFQKLEGAYKGILHWVVHHRWQTLVVALILFLLTLWGGRQLGTDYIPQFDAGDIAIVIETEVGTSAEKTDSVAQKVMEIFRREVPELIPSTLSSITGQTEDGTLSSVGFDEGKNISTILGHLVLPNERQRSAKEIGDDLRKDLKQIPEISSFQITAGSIISEAITGNVKPIEIELTGDDFSTLNTWAEKLQEEMATISGLTDITTTIDEGKQEMQILVDKRKASAMALNTALIAGQVRQSIFGAEAGKFTEKGEDYEINIRYAPEHRNRIEVLDNLVLTNLMGEQVPLHMVADVTPGTGPLQIQHKSQQRIVKVSCNLKGISLGEATNKVKEVINQATIPPELDIKVAGQVSEQSESFSDLYLILLIGILLVYMVMAAQFESFKDPFIIMFALPFTFVGIIAAFFVTGLTLSVTTFIGVIMLMGIVVNNGIVLVDYTNLLRARGLPLFEAVIEAARSRMRPVLMTSFTTMLGMLPMALSKGMGREMYSPLGVTIIGGLLVSTLVTLLLVPTIYSAFHIKSSKKTHG